MNPSFRERYRWIDDLIRYSIPLGLIPLIACGTKPVQGYFNASALCPVGSSATQCQVPIQIPSTSPTPTPTPTPTMPNQDVTTGILNGHCDVDTATGKEPFPYSGGNTTFHVHEYDKVNQTTTVDFFNLSTAGGSLFYHGSRATDFDHIQSIPSSTRFFLIVLNAQQNPGAVLEINGDVQLATDYKNNISAGAPAYTIGEPTVEGDQQLTELKVAFDPNVQAQDLLVPTNPACVVPNQLGPQSSNHPTSYRDGAFVIQAVNVDVELDPTTGAASQASGGPLWEGIVYNHLMDPGEVDPNPPICY